MNKVVFKKLNLNLLRNLPESEKRITFSTVVTMLRIALVPFIILSMINQNWGIAFWLFALAAFTDTLDGHIARWFNQKTFLGACLDPIADKILILSCFFTLAFVKTPLFAIPKWFLFLVLTKDLIVTFGAFFIFFVKKHFEVSPTLLGKLTMVVQVCFVGWLFACYFCSWMPFKTYTLSLLVVSLFVISTLFQYICIGIRQLGA